MIRPLHFGTKLRCVAPVLHVLMVWAVVALMLTSCVRSHDPDTCFPGEAERSAAQRYFSSELRTPFDGESSGSCADTGSVGFSADSASVSDSAGVPAMSAVANLSKCRRLDDDEVAPGQIEFECRISETDWIVRASAGSLWVDPVDK